MNLYQTIQITKKLGITKSEQIVKRYARQGLIEKIELKRTKFKNVPIQFKDDSVIKFIIQKYKIAFKSTFVEEITQISGALSSSHLTSKDFIKSFLQKINENQIEHHFFDSLLMQNEQIDCKYSSNFKPIVLEQYDEKLKQLRKKASLLNDIQKKVTPILEVFNNETEELNSQLAEAQKRNDSRKIAILEEEFEKIAFNTEERVLGILKKHLGQNQFEDIDKQIKSKPNQFRFPALRMPNPYLTNLLKEVTYLTRSCEKILKSRASQLYNPEKFEIRLKSLMKETETKKISELIEFAKKANSLPIFPFALDLLENQLEFYISDEFKEGDNFLYSNKLVHFYLYVQTEYASKNYQVNSNYSESEILRYIEFQYSLQNLLEKLNETKTKEIMLAKVKENGQTDAIFNFYKVAAELNLLN